MRRLAEVADRLSAHAGRALAVLIAAQLVLTAALVQSVHHNGWIFYQGGDQIWLTSTGWLVAHAYVPYALVGYGWPLVIAPIMALTGPDYISALPPTIVLQVLVLGPLVTFCVYWIGARLAGRLAGLWCAAIWVALPFAAIPLFVQRYHDTYVDQTLPQALGLSVMADYPSMVLVLVSAVFVLRSLERRSLDEALLAGLIAGFAAGMKPANYLFLAGPVLAYLLARRWRDGAAFSLALLPSVVTLLVWKQRGLGELPLFALHETRLAAGETLPLANNYINERIPLDFDVLGQNMDDLREFFWSNRVLEFIPFAGAFAVARRSPPAAGLLLGWLLSYVLVKGSSPIASVERGDFWRLVMPAFPAFVVHLALLPLLVPGLARRLGSRVAPVEARSLGGRTVLVAAIVLAAVPLALAGLARKVDGGGDAVILNDILTPVDGKQVPLRATRQGIAVRLTWDDRTHAKRDFYHVYRVDPDKPDVLCGRAGGGAMRCELFMLDLGVTRSRSYVDKSPQPGSVYRIGVGANWIDDASGGDVFVLSEPVRS